MTLLTSHDLDFLRRVRDGHALRPADRQEDRVRQRCRRLGLAEVLQSPRRWALTDAGRAVLAAE